MIFCVFFCVLASFFIQIASIASPAFDAFSTAYRYDIFKSDGIYAKESKNISSLFGSIFDQPMTMHNLTTLLLPPTLQEPFTYELLQTFQGVKETTNHSIHADNPHSFRPQMVFPSLDSEETITPHKLFLYVCLYSY